MSFLSAIARRMVAPSTPATVAGSESEPAPADLVLPEVIAMPAPPPVLALPPPRRPRHDLRHISPRRFAEVAHELYVEGSLKWREYQMVGFPSELHPDYDVTIGALTGQRAEPNRPRDLLAEWEQRLDFMRRHRDPSLGVAEHALAVLRHQAEPHP